MLSRATGWAKGGWKALRRTEPALLAAMLLAVLGIFAFAKIANELGEGELAGLDAFVASIVREPGAARPRGPWWLQGAARDLTALGSAVVLGGVVLSVSLGLAMARRRRQALFVAAAATTGLFVAGGLKTLFARERPETVALLDPIHSASFPSGHAFNSAVVYLTLGALLWRFMERPLLRAYVFASSVVLTVIIGFTRVYIGYHYASDVLAGWAGGLAWALVCVLLAEWISRRSTRGRELSEKP